MSAREIGSRCLIASLAMVLAAANPCRGQSLCGLIARRVSWDFLQSVGGIKIGTPYRDARGGVHLPIDCDISGTQAITTQPKALNSGWVVKKVRAKVKDKNIHIIIVSCLAHGRLTGFAPDASLGRLTAGSYHVVYDDPDGTTHPMGTIDF